jgi:hypothetical protein
VSQLPLEDYNALLVASFILGGGCWNSAIKMLGALSDVQRVELFNTFIFYVSKL